MTKKDPFSQGPFSLIFDATTENRTRNGALPLLYYTI